MYWFSADFHLGHFNIIEYTNRPFKTIEEMDETIINNFNSVVNKDDIIVHAGDFTLLHNKELIYKKYINRLKGNNLFLRGSHDYWLPKTARHIFEKEINGKFVVVCHYAMRTWARSHWNSFMLYGHSHGRLEPIGKQYDIGVDNNNFYPVSFDQIIEIMKTRSDNPNFIKERKWNIID